MGELVTTTVGPELFLVVGPVLPFEEVTVQVSATTAGGEGPRSEGVTERTDEDSKWKSMLMNSPRLQLDHPLVVGEVAYEPIAITQFRPFVVTGWFMQSRLHIHN